MRRTVLLGALASALTLLALGRAASADWAVKRSGNQALVAQAARALAERPNDRALATRLARLAGKSELARLLDEFRRRAEAEPPAYAPQAAYAQLLLAAGQPREAAAAFERAAASRPDAAAAIEGRATALRAAGDRDGALAAYQRALEIEKRPTERRHLLEALIGLTADPQQIETELAARRELLRLDPRDDAAALALADALERAGRPEEAARTLDPRLPLDQPPAERPRRTWKIDLALRAAALYAAAGDDGHAAKILAALQDALPITAVDRRREIWARAIEIARHQSALTALAHSIEDAGRQGRPPGAAEWDVLSQIRDELGNLEGALEAARRAAALEPRNVELGRRIVALLERLGRDEEVTAQLATLARLAPGEPRYTIELIERRFRHQRKEDAQALFDRALRQFAGNRTALADLAELASRWSEVRRAMDAWSRLRRLAPRDELAILGLGEQQFQSGKKELALRTWQALLAGRSSKAEGHLRLAEVLMEHELLAEATSEARQAQALEPKQPQPHRTTAQILERQRQPEAAIKEWETVLEMSTGPGRSAERHEARSRILALASRQGRGRLEERIRQLQAQVRGDPADREAALFLAEAEQRNGNAPEAMAVLRAIVERDRAGDAAGPGAHTNDDAQADTILALVRLLRQTRQIDEALVRLTDLTERFPARAREAHVQIADIQLERYDDRQALDHAEQAARLAPDNGQALVRIAEVQERAGESERALDTYRRAFARGASPAAAFALSRLLIRRGAPREAADVLRAVLRTAAEEETITETGRRAIDLEEYLGTLAELERVVAGLIFSAQNGAAYRRVLADVYRRLLPALYRAAADATAAADQRARMAQHGLRPLLELVTDAEGDPERGLVELLGMLGNPDAAPALARLAQGPAAPESDSLLKLVPPPTSEAQLAAVIALGRLGDIRGRAVVEGLMATPDASMRAAAVWAAGRIAAPESAERLAASASDPRSDVAALALLGLGRTHQARWGPRLARAAADIALPSRIRRAATVGLGLSGDSAGVPVLLGLLDSGDDQLARAAAAALGLLRAPNVLPALLERALLPPGAPPDGDGPALAALDRLASGRALDDEAKAIEGNHLDVDAMLDLLEAPPPPGPRISLWINHPREVAAILGAALARPREWKLRALAALDGLDDGPGLGRLTPAGAGALDPPAALALHEIAGGLRETIFALLEDPAPEVQAAALRVLVKLGDERLTPARIAAAVTRAPGELADAAAFAAARQVRASPDRAPALAGALGPLLADRASSWERRLAAVEVLRGLGEAGRRPLEAALGDPSPFVRAAAVLALAADAGEASTPALAGAAGDPVAAVRAAVARALAPRSAPAARAALGRLARDASPSVRAAVAQAHIEP